MPHKSHIHSAVIAFLVALTVVFVMVPTNRFDTPGAPPSAAEESTFDRVMRTRTIRCAYIHYPPVLNIDPNTKEISGIIPDIMNKIAERARLKIEWTTETNYGAFGETLKRPNVDLLCSTFWAMADTAEVGTVTMPLWFSAVGAYVRADDHRFDGQLDKINDPGITVSSVDGSIPLVIAQQDFPYAKILSMPQDSDYSLNMMNVMNKKADVTFIELAAAAEFLKNNPGKMRNIAVDQPLRVYANSLMVRPGEQTMINFINQSLQEMVYGGEIEKIIRRHETMPGSLYLPAAPYKIPVGAK